VEVDAVAGIAAGGVNLALEARAPVARPHGVPRFAGARLGGGGAPALGKELSLLARRVDTLPRLQRPRLRETRCGGGRVAQARGRLGLRRRAPVELGLEAPALRLAAL
jgi:hypothetical protein